MPQVGNSLTLSLIVITFSLCILCGRGNGLVSNPYNFKRLINSQPCTSEDEILIVVHSSIKLKYSHRRMTLRTTWLQPAHLYQILNAKVKIVFFVGATNITHLQNKLEYESEMYGDIVQDSYIDSYRNNTYKAMSYLKWTYKFCQGTKLLIKFDDDTLLNTRGKARFKRYVKQLLRLNTPIYAGRNISGTPVRNEKSPWYISYDVWPDKSYPSWFQGLVYFLSPSIAGELYEISLHTTYMHTDDVFVGILVDKLIKNGKSVVVKALLHLSIAEDYRGRAALANLLRKKMRISTAPFYHVPNLGVFWSTYLYGVL